MERSEAGDWRCYNPCCAYMRAAAKVARFLRVASCLLLLLPIHASAQSVDPAAVEFEPSPDHAALGIDGSPLVREYLLSVYVAGQSAVLKSVSIGKPALRADGKILVEFLPLLSPVFAAGVTYEAKVAASGPGGMAPSAVSGPFQFSTGCGVTLATPTYAIAPLGGMGSMAIAARTGCPWTVASSAPWLTLVSAASGDGESVVVFTAPINQLAKARTATLTIGGQPLSVTQDVVTCTYAVTATALPLAATFTVSNASLFTFTVPAGDRRALKRAASGTVAAAWYGNAFTIDVNVVGGSAQQLAVYLADYDASGRQETIDVLDEAGAVLNSQTVSEFAAGKYLVWTVRGHVTVRVTRLAGANALVSGLFLSNTTAPAGSGTSATFVSTDSATGGDWASLYGGSGYSIAADASQQRLSASGGVGALAVDTPGVCEWNAASDASWLTVTSGRTGMGPGSVYFSLAPTTSASPRTASVTIGDASIALTQAAGVGPAQPDPCAPIVGAEALSIFVTRVTQAGLRTSIDIQAASKSPVTRLIAKVDGVEVDRQPKDVDADVSGSRGFWIPTPAKGKHRVSVLGRNKAGCEMESFAILDFTAK